MPESIDGKKLSARQIRQWDHVFKATGSGAKATAVVKKSMRKKKGK